MGSWELAFDARYRRTRTVRGAVSLVVTSAPGPMCISLPRVTRTTPVPPAPPTAAPLAAPSPPPSRAPTAHRRQRRSRSSWRRASFRRRCYMRDRRCTDVVFLAAGTHRVEAVPHVRAPSRPERSTSVTTPSPRYPRAMPHARQSSPEPEARRLRTARPCSCRIRPPTSARGEALFLTGWSLR